MPWLARATRGLSCGRVDAVEATTRLTHETAASTPSRRRGGRHRRRAKFKFYTGVTDGEVAALLLLEDVADAARGRLDLDGARGLGARAAAGAGLLLLLDRLLGRLAAAAAPVLLDGRGAAARAEALGDLGPGAAGPELVDEALEGVVLLGRPLGLLLALARLLGLGGALLGLLRGELVVLGHGCTCVVLFRVLRTRGGRCPRSVLSKLAVPRLSVPCARFHGLKLGPGPRGVVGSWWSESLRLRGDFGVGAATILSSR